MRIERAADCRRESLERIESRKDQVAERIITASERAFRAAGADQFEGVADRICPRSTGVRDNGERPFQIVSFGEIEQLALRKVIGDASGLFTGAVWLGE